MDIEASSMRLQYRYDTMRITSDITLIEAVPVLFQLETNVFVDAVNINLGKRIRT